jgi:PhoPQ-activated pathogenicity-related protein
MVGVILMGACAHAADQETALDRYVAEPDPAYHYELVKEIAGPGFTQYVIDMTSQTWLTPQEVNRTAWQHWVRIVKPDVVEHETGLLIIAGGSNGKSAPTDIDKRLAAIALETRSVVTELKMVPNEPLEFTDDNGRRRTEDELIAYGWDKHLRGGRDEWLARLPMTKSAVRAMDTISEFMGGEARGSVKVERYVVAGGSKRGWTTWTTGAVDDRVEAIIPIVIDMLNVVPSFEHHYRVYGFFAPAVGDYVEMGVMDWQRRPEYQRLIKITEPYEYRHRYTMPKYLINASGDQFFVPDSGQFYWDDLIGEKHVRYVPNAGHGLDDTDVIESIVAYYHTILKKSTRPRFDWEFLDDGTLLVKPGKQPQAVKLWAATNPKARDFRIDSLGPEWKAFEMPKDAEGNYKMTVQAPDKGFTAYFAELTYPGVGRYPLKFTTQVKVVPDVYPFPPYEPKPIR